METVDGYLERWTDAGLLDARAAAAIREFETARGRPAGHQWRVLVALILGALLLAAGVLLFVAAHWERVSPLSRMLLVLSMLVLFHGLGFLVRPRFTGFATSMHAVGTISAGAAIALVGQIFNMQEHWPSAVLLWAMCAGAGWVLLRDPFQKTFTLLLGPAWIASEWMERMRPYHGSDIYLARIGLVVGAVYLTAFVFSRERAVFGILFRWRVDAGCRICADGRSAGCTCCGGTGDVCGRICGEAKSAARDSGGGSFVCASVGTEDGDGRHGPPTLAAL